MKKQKLVLALGASVAASTSLLAATSERYVYDASGNIVEKQLGDQVTNFDYTGNILKGSSFNAEQKQYRYDEAGRLVGESKGGQIVRELTYQFADKVTKVKNNGESSELFYNAEGQLVGTKSAGKTESFAWDGLALVSRGAKSYTIEEHIVGGVPAMIGNGVTVSDMIGSTLSVGKESYSGTVFGEGLENGLFTGKPFVEELGGFIFKYRNYSPFKIRWTSSDPSGYPDGSNSHIYVKNDPINFFDLLGLAACEPPTRTEWTPDIPLQPGGNSNNQNNGTSRKAKQQYEYAYNSKGTEGYPALVGEPSELGTTTDWIDCSVPIITISVGFIASDKTDCRSDTAYQKHNYVNGTFRAACDYSGSGGSTNQVYEGEMSVPSTLFVAGEK